MTAQGIWVFSHVILLALAIFCVQELRKGKPPMKVSHRLWIEAAVLIVIFAAILTIGLRSEPPPPFTGGF